MVYIPKIQGTGKDGNYWERKAEKEEERAEKEAEGEQEHGKAEDGDGNLERKQCDIQSEERKRKNKLEMKGTLNGEKIKNNNEN